MEHSRQSSIEHRADEGSCFQESIDLDATAVPKSETERGGNDTTRNEPGGNDRDSHFIVSYPQPDGRLASEIDIVARKILEVMNDETILPEAMGIAQFMLLCKRISCERIVEQLQKPGARALVDKLLDCESDFMSPTPRSLGIDIVSYISADKIQKSLDVKQPKIGCSIKRSTDRIIPDIKPIILYGHPTCVWVRFHSRFDNITIDGATVVQMCDFCDYIYEAYIEKTKNVAQSVNDLIALLESKWDADIIFCSELALFTTNKLLFISNYVKFMWCYVTNRNSFNPTTPDEIRVMGIYLTYSLLFLQSTNLTNMSEDTHNPLIAYTGERPKIAMAKFKTDKTYIVEGNRAMQTVNKGSDFGTKSNYLEIITRISLNDSAIANIL